jgi:predicted dehydrogenase
MENGSAGALRVVVVGAGTGGRLSIGAAVGSPGYELVGIADRSPEAAESAALDLAPGTPTFSEVSSALERLHPDVVCVSTWAPSHREITEQAVAAGVRGLLLEKPIAGSITDGEAILDRLAAAGVPVVVPHGLMSMPAPRHVRDEIRAGALGPLRKVEIDCTGWDLINAGIHWLQFVVACLGDDRVATVECSADVSTRTYRDGFMVETSAVTSAVTEGGVRLLVRTGDDIAVASDTGTRIHFAGDLGTAEYHPWSNGYRIERSGAGSDVTPNGDQPTGHRFFLAELLRQISNVRPDQTIPRQSLQALEIVRAAYVSARRGTEVALPLTHDDEAAHDAADDAWIPGEAYDGRAGGRNGRALPPPEHTPSGGLT